MTTGSITIRERDGRLWITISAAIRWRLGLRAGDTMRWRKQSGGEGYVITFFRDDRRIKPDMGTRRTDRATKLRALLHRQGSVLMRRMLKKHASHLADSNSVCARFNIRPAQLRAATKANRVIACRHEAGLLYPIEQFCQHGIADWAPEAVRALGNGDAAVHFFLVRRRSLGWQSFSEALRDAGERSEPVVQLMRKAIRRLAAH